MTKHFEEEGSCVVSGKYMSLQDISNKFPAEYSFVLTEVDGKIVEMSLEEAQKWNAEAFVLSEN